MPVSFPSPCVLILPLLPDGADRVEVDALHTRAAAYVRRLGYAPAGLDELAHAFNLGQPAERQRAQSELVAWMKRATRIFVFEDCGRTPWMEELIALAGEHAPRVPVMRLERTPKPTGET